MQNKGNRLIVAREKGTVVKKGIADKYLMPNIAARSYLQFNQSFLQQEFHRLESTKSYVQSLGSHFLAVATLLRIH
jgi:hypothetical protein